MSVFRLRGRTTPCSLKNRPHALHKVLPSGLRRQSGVVVVLQLEHSVELLLDELEEDLNGSLECGGRSNDS